MYRKTIERTASGLICASIHTFDKNGKLVDLVGYKYFESTPTYNGLVAANLWADKKLKELNQ